jgi:predicted CoA-substrate-specific enzyme activase
MKAYLGLDVGSVSTNIAVLGEDGSVLDTLYMRTNGMPIWAVQNGLAEIANRHPDITVKGVGTTGSGRHLAATMIGADVVKNEITAHAVAAMHVVPDVKTVLEIGGQDSKLIIIRDGVVTDFAMNTVCAAGTGSFLDQQAARLNIPIEQFGSKVLEAKAPVRIAGRCAVFAESDMIHKQQAGHGISDILNGLCEALVRNYLNNVGKGKKIEPPIVFQGGVAANAGMKKAFESTIGISIVIPPYYGVMGAIGAGLLAEERKQADVTSFRGFDLIHQTYASSSFECNGCPNLCEVIEMKIDSSVAGRWGDRCGKWGRTTKY